jgi:hypothetical protein
VGSTFVLIDPPTPSLSIDLPKWFGVKMGEQACVLLAHLDEAISGGTQLSSSEPTMITGRRCAWEIARTVLEVFKCGSAMVALAPVFSGRDVSRVTSMSELSVDEEALFIPRQLGSPSPLPSPPRTPSPPLSLSSLAKQTSTFDDANNGDNSVGTTCDSPVWIPTEDDAHDHAWMQLPLQQRSRDSLIVVQVCLVVMWASIMY